jgi:GR25 family glycosyltransferase involved in LPS biosynthesis
MKMITFDDVFPSKIYMNLDKRPDRKIQAEKEFARMGISPIRMSGVFIKGTDNQLVNNALGCMFAHIECLKWGLEQKTNVFIFEDDIQFIDKPNIRELTDVACAELEQREWDMFYLATNILRPHYQVSKHLSKLTHGQSTVAYGVNKNFIPKLLNYYLPTLTTIKQIWIDVIYADTVIPNNNCFVSIPMMGVQREGYSDIMENHERYEDYLQARYDANFVPLTET